MSKERAMLTGFGVVAGGKKPVARVGVSAALREASTGASVVGRIWAVGTEPESALAGPVLLEKPVAEVRVELAFYRKYTEALLRRYLRMAMANGRVPSLLGRELFRGNVTHYRVTGLEDVVIFCADVEKCLRKLSPGDLGLVRRIAIQQYTQLEAACLLGLTFIDTRRKYGRALDRLTELLLKGGLMEPLKSCQGGKEVKVGVSEGMEKS